MITSKNAIIDLSKERPDMYGVSVGVGYNRDSIFNLFSSNDETRFIKPVVIVGASRHRSKPSYMCKEYNTLREEAVDCLRLADIESGHSDKFRFVLSLKCAKDDEESRFVVALYTTSTDPLENFGRVGGIYIRLTDTSTGEEFCKIQYTNGNQWEKSYEGKSTLILGEFVLTDHGYEFRSLGKATAEKSLRLLIDSYR